VQREQQGLDEEKNVNAEGTGNVDDVDVERVGMELTNQYSS
jgi:hypothetical protein